MTEHWSTSNGCHPDCPVCAADVPQAPVVEYYQHSAVLSNSRVVTVVRDRTTSNHAMYVGNSKKWSAKLIDAGVIEIVLGRSMPFMLRCVETTLCQYEKFPDTLDECVLLEPLPKPQPPAELRVTQHTLQRTPFEITFAANGDGEKKPAAEETPCAATKMTSREWATQFVVENHRFPHALDYANAGYDQGGQCDCSSIGDCVLRDACNGHSCDRNCYTQQLKDYIVMSNTKRQPAHPERPQTTEAVLMRINELEYSGRRSGKTPTRVYIPKWAEELVLNGIHLSHMRMAMKWRAGSWRPYSIYGLECIWDTAANDLAVE